MQANVGWKSKVVACRLQTGYSTCRSSPWVATDMRLSRRTTKSAGIWERGQITRSPYRKTHSSFKCACPGFDLAHAEQAPLDHLEAVRLQVGEQEEQPVFRRRQGAVLIHAKPACGAGFPIEAPRGHPCLERRLEGRDEALKLVERQAGEIEELCRADLESTR